MVLISKFSKYFFNKYVAIFKIIHIASQIGGQQQTMKQFPIMLLVPRLQIGPFYDEIWPVDWQVQNRYLKI